MRPVFREALCVFGAIAVALAMTAPAAAKLAASDWRFVVVALGVYGSIAAIALAGLDDHPHRRLGVANMITGFRAGLTALVAAAFTEFERLGPGGDETLAWALVSVVLLALALDGVDGFAARHHGTHSDFGGRFDMEVDALLILILSLLACASGKAGVFVVFLGAMRYGYLAIHAMLPRLSKTLRPSILRKAVCVIQVSVLCAVMTPVVEPPFSNAIALAALALLTASFARDLFDQVRQGDGRKTG
ncbi:CDP-alcohol phosphatidyltransferase family protein [Aureimonas sp. SA4125]|uniref:CDP-alcohol phosphatidyltransferase family protein n=1 Tax=Aureimonas sp. SA4125 TaxID=2826993 RepID=UPI001CC78A6E|nr:CDP-alcohol phosphatidyltransferase family protein [Aureimonas sp. SA4125]